MTVWTAPKTWVKREKVTSAGLNVQLRDNMLHIREKLALVPNYVLTTHSGSNPTIASGTFADVHGNLNIGAFTPRSASSLIMISLGIIVTAAAGGSENLSFDINIDGTRIGDATYGSWMVQHPTANMRNPLWLTTYTTMSATTHTVKPQWRRDGGGTWTAHGGVGQKIYFMVYEMGGIEP